MSIGWIITFLFAFKAAYTPEPCIVQRWLPFYAFKLVLDVDVAVPCFCVAVRSVILGSCCRLVGYLK